MILQNKIKSYAEKHNIEYKEIAKQSGITTTALSNFLNGKSEIDFYSALKIVRYLFEDQETEVMTEYILTLNKPENIRSAMEYASFNVLTDLLGTLIGQELQSKNAINREWASVYELDYQYKTGQLKAEELMINSKFINVKSPEMIVLRTYFELKSYYARYQYTYMLDIASVMNNYIHLIKDEFIKTSMQLRIKFVLSYANLFLANFDKAREYANFILENRSNLTGSIYHVLGYSYIFENTDMAIDYLNKANEVNQKVMPSDIDNVNKTLRFIHNYTNRTHNLPYDNSLSSKLELVHHYIRIGNNEKAIEIFNNIRLDDIEHDKGYYYHLNALLNNSIDYHYYSIREFRKNGNKFFAMLSAKELLRMGERKSNIEAAIDLAL